MGRRLCAGEGSADFPAHSRHQARRTVPSRFLFAGIRHVGETNARRLARHFGD